MKTNEILQLIGEQAFLDKVYQYAYRRCNTSHEAEDLCSDIILAVISAVHKQEHIDNFYAFVWTIARRVYADFSEKRSRAQQTVSIENEDLSLPAKANEIDQFIEETAQREELRRIFREIAFLSKAYREVMVLYYLDEMKVADIARKLGISEAAVKQRLFSARNTVRKEVETMSERKLSLKPITMDFMGSGRVTGNSPFSLANRTFSQNLIYACKDKAKSAKELSDELGVPMLYVEEELEIQLHGVNGTYGTLRKQGDKYIANIIIVDEADRIAASQLYEQHANAFCDALHQYVEENGETLMALPFVNKPKDIQQLLWLMITNAVWGFAGETEKIMAKEHFGDVKEAIATTGRKFTCCAIARKEDEPKLEYGYGSDGCHARDFCDYSLVEFRNIYGAKKDAFHRAGDNIAQDMTLAFIIRSIGGVAVDSLTEEQKELAARGLESGLLRKNDGVLEPAFIVTDYETFNKVMENLNGLYSLLKPCCEALASAVAKHIKTHIQKHLLDEYKTYNMAIGVSITSCVIEKCIERGLLNEPENRIGPEGVLLVVEK